VSCTGCTLVVGLALVGRVVVLGLSVLGRLGALTGAAAADGAEGALVVGAPEVEPLPDPPDGIGVTLVVVLERPPPWRAGARRVLVAVVAAAGWAEATAGAALAGLLGWTTVAWPKRWSRPAASPWVTAPAPAPAIAIVAAVAAALTQPPSDGSEACDAH